MCCHSKNQHVMRINLSYQSHMCVCVCVCVCMYMRVCMCVRQCSAAWWGVWSLLRERQAETALSMLAEELQMYAKQRNTILDFLTCVFGWRYENFDLRKSIKYSVYLHKSPKLITNMCEYTFSICKRAAYVRRKRYL